ncbi:protein SUPPRESSOR OF FRI 4-like [Dorcoceras hygrometricum]|uniref:Protein SUPPRESSOR OF FRI 4-like n=1 Tax=Dorcoceras hygrometricum TaxID=472368 RepID=A0A2Z7BU04_9LAMI|nr:protein SUPPRESSOR OF FRI 4-like [Dorcoceras hygrometricum]
MALLELVVQSLVVKSLRLDFPTTGTSSCDWMHSNSWFIVAHDLMHCSCMLFILRRSTCWFSSFQRASAESLARRQNAVVSINSNDIVLLSLTPNTNRWLHCSSLLIDLPVRRRFSLALLFTTADSFSSTADH